MSLTKDSVEEKRFHTRREKLLMRCWCTWYVAFA